MQRIEYIREDGALWRCTIIMDGKRYTGWGKTKHDAKEAAELAREGA